MRGSLRPVKPVDPVVDELDLGQRKPTERRRKDLPRSGFQRTGGGRQRRPGAPGIGARGAAGQGRAAGAVGVADRQRRGVRGPAGRAARAARSWSTWTTCRCRELAAARDVLVITSTFGDGGPPDNGAGLLGSPRCGRMRPRSTASGTRCSASATGPTPTSAATPSRSTAGSPSWARRRCSSAPSARPTTTSRWTEWADAGRRRCSAPVEPAANGRCRPSPADHGGRAVHPRQARSSRRCRRNVVLTAPISRKRGAPVRLRHLRTRRRLRGRRLARGVRHQRPRDVVDAWLAATGLRGDELGRGRRRRADACATR